MIAEISGIVMSSVIFQPAPGQKGKPQVVVSVVQNTERGSDMIKVKSDDLASVSDFPTGSVFRRLCVISPYNMDGRSGISCKIFHGRQVDLPAFSPVPEKSEPRKMAAV